jgi:hypothetical protein
MVTMDTMRTPMLHKFYDFHINIWPLFFIFECCSNIVFESDHKIFVEDYRAWGNRNAPLLITLPLNTSTIPICFRSLDRFNWYEVYREYVLEQIMLRSMSLSSRTRITTATSHKRTRQDSVPVMTLPITFRYHREYIKLINPDVVESYHCWVFHFFSFKRKYTRYFRLLIHVRDILVE